MKDPRQQSRLLCIDDSRSQLELYRRQYQDHFEVLTASTYDEAMASLTSLRPDVIVLDMVMPQVDGLEFLSILKGAPTFRSIPVVMVSSETNPSIVHSAFLKGAADFVRKPYDPLELQLRLQRLFDPERRGKGVPTRALVVEALADLAQTRDDDTGLHLMRIKQYSSMLALAAAKRAAFRGRITPEFLELIGDTSVLHDIGKVGIPDAVLGKPGRLTPEEFEIMKQHTVLGASTIERVRVQFPDVEFLEMARDIALSHHEHWDGNGYPHGLSGEHIPLAARIVGIVDVFDALTSRRVYKEAFTIDDALDVMKKGRGTQFDPDLFDIFMLCVPEFRRIHASAKLVDQLPHHR